MSRLRILVTGANGQLGGQVRRAAARVERESGDTYIYTDIEELDITDQTAVERFITQHAITTIVNCAAYTNVDRAESDQTTAHRINATACEILAKAAYRHNIGVIHISTDYVFDGKKRTPYAPQDPTSPLGVYGRTKLEGEEAIRRSGAPYIIVRTAWLYSEESHNFLLTILRLASERESIKVVEDQCGTPTYAADLASLIVEIVSNFDIAEQCGTYHFSNLGECSWYDFAKAIVEMSGEKCVVTPCSSNEYPTAVERPKYSVLDKSSTKEHFGIEIDHWHTALERAFSNLKR